MIRFFNIFFIIMVFGVSLSCTAGSDQRADQYWAGFRDHVSNHEYKKIAESTVFPFELRGEADFIPVKMISRKDFYSVLDKILNQVQIEIVNGQTREKTTREVVIGKHKLGDNDILIKGEQFRVSDLVFKKVGNKWKLYRGYLVEE